MKLTDDEKSFAEQCRRVKSYDADESLKSGVDVSIYRIDCLLDNKEQFYCSCYISSGASKEERDGTLSHIIKVLYNYKCEHNKEHHVVNTLKVPKYFETWEVPH